VEGRDFARNRKYSSQTATGSNQFVKLGITSKSDGIFVVVQLSYNK